MARIQTELMIDAPAEAVWKLVTDWPAHGRWIPLTTVRIDPSGPARPGVGTHFTGRTELGPIGFDDPMEVLRWQPPAGAEPGTCRVTKLGPWVPGWAEIRVEPVAGGTRLVWIEDIRPRWTPRWAAPVVTAVGSLLFGRTLRRMAAELARTSPE